MSKLDVLFVHPNASKKIYQGLSTNFSAIEPPIWAALLANHTRSKGYKTKILDCEAENVDSAAGSKIVLEHNPRLVTIVVYGQQPSASTQNMAGARDLCIEIKKSRPDLKILLVGLHPSAVSRETLQNELVDFVCQGEGPRTITKLLEIDMDNTEQLSEVPGLWYKKGIFVKFNDQAPLIKQEDLSTELPGMAWDLLPMDKYRTSNWHSMSNNDDRTPFASLYTSLGCPFKCSFCCINAPFGNNNLENSDRGASFRYWDVDFIMSEFQKIHDMGIKNVKIADEMFVYNQKHFMKVCEKLIEKKFDFNIWAYARVDTVKPRYLKTLKEAGVNWLALGIESGNTKVRKDVIKGKFQEVDIRDLVEEIKDAGINVIGNYIFGLPEDNLETMRETLELAKELNCEFANFYSTMAYPGSKLYLEALKEGWELPDSYVGYSQHSYETKPLPTKHISAAEVLSFRDKAFDEYYANDEYLSLVKDKFGQTTYEGIVNMTKYTLKRELLEK